MDRRTKNLPTKGRGNYRFAQTVSNHESADHKENGNAAFAPIANSINPICRGFGTKRIPRGKPNDVVYDDTDGCNAAQAVNHAKTLRLIRLVWKVNRAFWATEKQTNRRRFLALTENVK